MKVSIPLLLSSFATTLGTVSAAAGPACHNGPRELLVSSAGQGFSSCSGNAVNLDPQSLPIEITSVSGDGSTVSFEVSQEFIDTFASQIAVLFDPSDTQQTCDVSSNAGVDWVSQEYTAVCDGSGKADVKIFLYLCGDTPAECDYCETPGDDSDYYEFDFELICSEQCITDSPTSGPTDSPPGPPGSPTSPGEAPSGSNGDPHFKTWTNEHYEYHGQCDLVLAKDPNFADGLGLDVHIRTKLVRFWSYIKNVAIRIGSDVLELQGSSDPLDGETHYWYNLEYRGAITSLGGFPVTFQGSTDNIHKRVFEIDLSSKYPGQKIKISSYREFLRVDFVHASQEAFGNTVGLLGEFATGTTLARDGMTRLNDYWEFGNEWQVLPSEDMLFHAVEQPQFPNKCVMPEDPRGERRRRLDESTISEEAAEKACSTLTDPLDKKDCIYDILATQDLGMVGAF